MFWKPEKYRRPDSSGRATIRVGFDARWYNDSGVGTYVSELASALAQRDEIELLLYEDPANPLPLPAAARLQRISVHAGKYSVAGQWELARRCREDGLDLVHSPFYVAPWLAQCPLVVTMHDLIPFRFPIYSWPKRMIVQQGYWLAALKAKQIVADSDNTAQDIQQILGVEPDRITVVRIAASGHYNAVSAPGEAAFLEQKHGVTPPYVMLAGARNWRTKNLETALRVVGLVRQESGTDFQTVIYGSPEGFIAAGGEDRWRHLNLKCTGFIPAEELAMLYRNATVFLMPSLYEGFGLPLLEAMTCGCAVVCSNGGALAEIAGSGAQVFDPLDVPGMAAAVWKLLRDAVNRRLWRDAALRRAAEFSWAKAARETVSVYHRTRKPLRLGRALSDS